MGEVLTTIVVHFDGSKEEAADADCIYELDEVANEGETTFQPGEPCYFLIKHSDTVRVNSVKATNGECFKQGTVVRTKEDNALFVELNSKNYKPSISYSPDSAPSAIWYGNQGGAISANKQTKELNISSGAVPCFAKITFPVTFQQWKLIPGPIVFPEGEDTYDIYIVIYLEKAL